MLNTYTYLNPKTWIADRYNGIGASEFATLCLENNYQTPLELFDEKVTHKPKERTEETLKLFDAGHTQEPVTLFKALKKYKIKGADLVYRNHLQNKPMPKNSDVQILTEFFHPQNKNVFCHPDMIVKIKNKWINFQAKYIRHRGEWDFNNETESGLPFKIWIQVQGEMMITGIKKTIVCANYQGVDYHYFPVKADPKFFITLEKLCATFWDFVINKTPPDAQSRADALTLFPNKNFNALTVPEEIATMTILQKDKYKQNNKRIKYIKEMNEKIKADVMSLMGVHTVIQTEEGKQLASFTENPGEKFMSIKEIRENKKRFNYCIKNKIIVECVNKKFNFS